MLRSEAMAIAEQLQPEGFKFNSLDLHADGDVGLWIATYLNVDTDPPEVVVERWHDVYTDADPDPDAEAASEEDAEEVETVAVENGAIPNEEE